jgi:hypothetical protein
MLREGDERVIGAVAALVAALREEVAEVRGTLGTNLGAKSEATAA